MALPFFGERQNCYEAFEYEDRRSEAELNVIATELPPSRFLKSIATALHTKSFNCFVTTARHLILWNLWNTQIYLGDPGVDKQFKLCLRIVYTKGLQRAQIYDIHRRLSAQIDEYGDIGMDLGSAMGNAYRQLLDAGFVQSHLTSRFER
jgi:hypothetical protein